LSCRLQDRAFGLKRLSRVRVSVSKAAACRSAPHHTRHNIYNCTNARKQKTEKKVNGIWRRYLVVTGEGHLYLFETALVLLLSERAALRQTSLASGGSAQNLNQSHQPSSFNATFANAKIKPKKTWQCNNNANEEWLQALEGSR
jgi:hypothetical protein